MTGQGWNEIPRGAVILEPGNAHHYQTGDWRSFRPIWLKDRCIQCLRCWVMCPDSSIMTEDGKVTGIDYSHCKGCGICANECPAKVDAIKMVKEDEADDSDKVNQGNSSGIKSDEGASESPGACKQDASHSKASGREA
jgi:pyruvate ferredoxin oxidoreductase delta subunit